MWNSMINHSRAFIIVFSLILFPLSRVTLAQIGGSGTPIVAWDPVDDELEGITKEEISIPITEAAPLPINWQHDFAFDISEVYVAPPIHSEPYEFGADKDYYGEFVGHSLILSFNAGGMYVVRVHFQNESIPDQYYSLAVGSGEFALPLTLQQYLSRRTACKESDARWKDIETPRGLWLISRPITLDGQQGRDETLDEAAAHASQNGDEVFLVGSVRQAVSIIIDKYNGEPLDIVLVGHGVGSLINLGSAVNRATQLAPEPQILVDNFVEEFTAQLRGKIKSITFISCCVGQLFNNPPPGEHLIRNLANRLSTQDLHVQVTAFNARLAINVRKPPPNLTFYLSVGRSTNEKSVYSGNAPTGITSDACSGEGEGHACNGTCPDRQVCANM